MNPFSGTFDPGTDPAGIYTYTVNSAAPCAPVSSTVTVTVNPGPDAGSDNTIDLCSTDPVIDLFTQLGGTPDAGGSWVDPNNNVFGGILDPSVDPAGSYVYTVNGLPPCASSSATITVNISTPPNAGLNGTLDLCESDPATAMFAQLGGSPDAI